LAKVARLVRAGAFADDDTETRARKLANRTYRTRTMNDDNTPADTPQFRGYIAKVEAVIRAIESEQTDTA